MLKSKDSERRNLCIWLESTTPKKEVGGRDACREPCAVDGGDFPSTLLQCRPVTQWTFRASNEIDIIRGNLPTYRIMACANMHVQLSALFSSEVRASTLY